MKSRLRKELRAARRALSPREHALRSLQAARHVIRSAAFKPGARVAVYLPFDGETDTSHLLAAAARRRIRIYVPVITDLRHKRMAFCRLSGSTRRGTFGIEVPRDAGGMRGGTLAARWLDLVVVPLVGVDASGHRLGMGGGFYDRAFAFRRLRSHWRGPLLIGLAFDRQRIAGIGAAPWDVRIDALATESGLEHFRRSAR